MTIPDSRDARGVFAFSQATIRTQENVGDRSDVLILMLKIKREGKSILQLGDYNCNCKEPYRFIYKSRATYLILVIANLHFSGLRSFYVPKTFVEK